MFVDANLSQARLSLADLTLTHRASGRALVQGLSLRLDRGSTVAIIGESGSGKTLTAMALAGLLPAGIAASGTLSLNGAPVDLDRPAAARPVRIAAMGVVFQNPMAVLNPRLTIRDHILEALPDAERKDRRQAEVRCLALLDEVGIAEGAGKLDAWPHQLSGGQAQRVVIALAIARRAGIIIADEPTTALDATVQARILDLLDDLQRRHGFSILLITHDMALVHDRADHVLVMQAGTVVEAGPASDVMVSPRHQATRHLVSALPGLKPGTDKPAGVEAPPLVTVAKLSKSFRRGTNVLNQIDLRIAPDDAVGIVGESGSGKTTLARIIAGLERPSTGEVRFARGDRRRGGIGYVFQDPWSSIAPHQSLLSTVAEPLLAQGVRRIEAIARARKMLAEVDLPEESWDRLPETISGGQRQRVGIARAVIQSPDLLIADEPVAALDSTNKARVLRLLHDLRQRHRLTLLLISHDLQIVRELCHRTVVMAGGNIVEQGPTDQVLAAPSHPYTRDLLAAVPGRTSRAARLELHPIGIESI